LTGSDSERPEDLEDIVAAAEELLLVENALLPLAAILPNGRFAMANRALSQMLGYEVGELLGREVSDFTQAGDGGFARCWPDVLAGRATAEHVTDLRRRDGHWVRARVAASVVRDASNEPRLVIWRAQEA